MTRAKHELRTVAFAASILVCAIAAAPARAGDGRIEINQACATATGCGAGDAPGFPVSTAANASYVMTGDLVVPDANTNGVHLAAGSTLDMAGFAISGPTTCTGTPPACTGTGNGIGILASAGTTIRDGRVTGMGEYGVQAGIGTRVERVAAVANGSRGIIADGAAAQIVDCRLQRNGLDGIDMAYGNVAASLILRNAVWGNGRYGIVAVGALILDNAIAGNADLGLNTAFGNADAPWGRNQLEANNGGNTNPQASGSNQMGPNVCGNALCP